MEEDLQNLLLYKMSDRNPFLLRLRPRVCSLASGGQPMCWRRGSSNHSSNDKC
jgi:hypothetical protein